MKSKKEAFWGTMFFSGLIPGPAGTYGAFIFLLFQLIIWSLATPYCGGIFFPVVSFAIGLLTTPGTIKYLREKYGKTKRHTGKMTDTDFNEINIDEAHGMAMAGAPIFLFQPAHWIVWLIVAFSFFRFFDILKPLGIKAIEKKMSKKSDNLFWQGFVIMLDDTIAGLYSAACVLIGLYFLN
jgi:phosphatidylglycerophosphatase A